MITLHDIRFGKRFKPRALQQVGVVFRDGVAYIRLNQIRKDRVPMVVELEKKGSSWAVCAIGRHDCPNYVGLFPTLPTEEPAPAVFVEVGDGCGI